MAPYNVLFLCTGNSARSILGEVLLNFWGRDRFRAFSAGSHPKGEVHPLALEVLERSHLPTKGLRSKSWDEFAGPDATPLDFVFTVCGNAAKEQCPYWPGQPVTAHWGVDDPAAVEGSDEQKRRAFHRAFRELDARIKLFTSLKLENLDTLALKKRLDDIGRCQDRRVKAHDAPSLGRRVVAEGLGTSFLLAAIVGSGIMAERLAAGNAALALLANTIATGAALVALILAFGSLSAHFNPAVTLVQAALGVLRWRDVGPYLVAQTLGAFAGVATAHLMFGQALFSASTHPRAGAAQILSEAVAMAGLLVVIWGCSRTAGSATAFAVGAYITAAYWFTASTSFANPAVTLARAATDSFAGIRPADVPGFLLGQLIGTAAATLLLRWLYPAAAARRSSEESRLSSRAEEETAS
jgi:glycerol uptake facilitator-like aquaporin/protein-tyrosine-phosphatase